MSTRRKTGRRPGDPEVTKQAILQAARDVFGESGFERATIRAIGARAEVDPALVHHHFGTKHSLFVAAHRLPVDPARLVKGLADLPRDQLAPQIVRLYLTTFGAPGSPALSLLRAAATNESAARMLREFLGEVLLEHASSLIPYPDARLRVVLLVSQLIGVLFTRHAIGIPEVADLEVEELVVLLGPMVDRYLNDPDLTV